MPTTRRHLLAGLAAASGALAGIRPAAAQTRWQMATAYPDGNFHTRNVRAFLEEVQSATGGKLQVQLQSNAALLPMNQIKRGVQTGQVQMGEILLSAYGNEDPFFELDSIPQLVTSYDDAKRLMRLSLPFIEARFSRQGLVPLFQVPWPPGGFYTNAPLTSVEQLRGTKLRTFNVMTNRFATLVGAAPTLVQQAELPQAFATGVVNVMVTSAQTGVDTQAWDYAKFFTPVGFTFTRNMVMVSRRAFETLSAEERKAVQEAAAKAETRGWAASAEAQRTQEAALATHGMTVARPSPELLAGLATVSRTMVDEWLTRSGEDGRKVIDAYRAG
ncbi:TRAP transporter substrate-binding protein [Roseomonas sp. NAR14]|uniref:TRAP transporter substrate-binding protein n=1 Tax=Roseomonas acroporae TaxID=2937791 RepID=A0A9X1Y848_9PROT|nr:TRAP transporter substrate-binding protein [Roseomonas acroporae]MCK8784852.1 TRAP transporter substrate-binding protein [Roseomonas acroporae]